MAPDKPANGKPTNSEFGQMVAWLMLQRPAGVSAQEWNAIIAAQIGNNPMGRTRAQIALELADWFYTFPKGAA